METVDFELEHPEEHGGVVLAELPGLVGEEDAAAGGDVGGGVGGHVVGLQLDVAEDSEHPAIHVEFVLFILRGGGLLDDQVQTGWTVLEASIFVVSIFRLRRKLAARLLVFAGTESNSTQTFLVCRYGRITSQVSPTSPFIYNKNVWFRIRDRFAEQLEK